MWRLWKKRATPQIDRKVQFDRIERLMGTLSSECGHPSVLFFTVHKAASAFVGELLHHIAERNRIIPINYAGYLTSTPSTGHSQTSRMILESVLNKSGGDEATLPSAELSSISTYELSRLFPNTGFYFGPLRKPDLLCELPDLTRYRTIIQLRDPRDCLTSLYFSQAYSHAKPRNENSSKTLQKRRRQARESTIDQHVLSHAPAWLELYEQYAEALRTYPGVCLLKYERMVLDFPGWLEQLEHAWGLEFDRELRQFISQFAEFDVKQENVHSHKRQVLPGDHLRKLEPATIHQLTEMFQPVLEQLGYPLEAAYSSAA